MKFRHLLTLTLLLIFGVSITLADDKNMADSILTDTSFQLRGNMSKIWRDKDLKFALTDPVKNTSHIIDVDKNGRFDMAVPMRGVRQDMYLYIDGTVTLPVCAGDTIELNIEDDDMYLSSPDSAVSLDLQMAHALHRKMRGRAMKINHVFNEFFVESDKGQSRTLKSDSLYVDLVTRIGDYHARYKEVIDTFVSHHGSPRSQEYFRVSHYFSPLKWLLLSDDGLKYTSMPGYLTADVDGSKIVYSDYDSRWLLYPAYRDFAINYLNVSASKAHDTFYMPNDSRDPFVLKSDLRRLIAPDQLLADIADSREIAILIRLSGPADCSKYINKVYERCATPAFRNEIAKLSPDMERVSPGALAPALVMTDIDGNKFTLSDFRGKYVYLDFWDFGCAPCIREFATMPTFKEYFADALDSLEIVTVCASRHPKNDFSDFLKKHHMTDRNLIFDSKLSDKVYNQGFFPVYVLIGPDGRIVEFNTDRPSQILRRSKSGNPTSFEKAIKRKNQK